MVFMPHSPPCERIRHHLLYHGINFTTTTPKEFKKGKSPDTHYTKVPALFVSGRQVNDSFIILKHLTSLLYHETFNQEWEVKLAYGLQIAMEIESFRNPLDYPALLTFVGIPVCIGRWVPTSLVPLGKWAAGIEASRAEKNEWAGELQPARSYLADFRTLLGDKPFVNGEEPGQLDVSMFGTLVSWLTVPSVKQMLKDTDLVAFFTRMKEVFHKLQSSTEVLDEQV